MAVINPSVPTLPFDTPPSLVPFLSAIKSNIDNLTGVNNQASKVALSVDVESLSSAVEGSASAPPSISGLSTTGRFSAINLTWDAYDASSDVEYAIIYRALSDNSKLAVAVGTSRALTYTDIVSGSQDYYYWISAVSSGGTEGPLNAISGKKGNASLNPTYVKQVLAEAITANEIAGSTLSDITSNVGTIVSGELKPDATFDIDVTNKELLVSGSAGYAADDYVIVNDGRLAQYRWNGSDHAYANELSRMERGIADSGDTVAIPGVFTDQPRIVVAPHAIKSFASAYSGQDQAVFCDIENITQYSPGQWQFDAVARLQLADYAGVTTINWSNGPSSNSTLSSGVYTTQATTEKFVVHVDMSSVRGTGTAPNYYYRTSDVTVYYRVALSGGAWLIGATKSADFGETILPISASLEVSLAAGTYEFYVEVVFADDTGSFQVGAGSYHPNSATQSNDFSILGYSFELTGHTEISTGALRWQAIG